MDRVADKDSAGEPNPLFNHDAVPAPVPAEGITPSQFEMFDVPAGMEDYRGSKPRLHTLYLGFAITALSKLDSAIVSLHRLGKTSLSGVICAMYEERQKLLMSSAAYYEAHNILASIGRTKRVGLDKLPDLREPRIIEKKPR